MILEIGILFAFGAFLFWGVGDFLIQRSSRKFGDFETLFILSVVGLVCLTPFVYRDLPALFSFQDRRFLFLLIASLVLFTAAILDFEALRIGKLAIVEPVFSLEVPVAVAMAMFVLKEQVTLLQGSLILATLLGLVLISLRTTDISSKDFLERGIIIALLAAVFFGLSNFFVGFASRVASPLLTNWFLCLVHLILVSGYLIYNKRIPQLARDMWGNRGLALTMSLIDNGAWVFYAFAASLAPISIVVPISESYVGLAVLLGIVVNKERILMHQKIGLAVAFASVVALAMVTGG